MKILTIAYYTLLRNFRDRKSLSLTLLFPILLILILGTALGKAYSPDTIEKINVTYLSEDSGQMATQFESFLESDDISQLLAVQKVSSYEEGKKTVDNKKAFSFIYLPSDYTQNIMTGAKAEIKVYENKDSLLNMAVVKNIVDSFVNGGNTVMTLQKMGSAATGYQVFKNIEDKPLKTTGTIPRAIDYYAVTMLAMTLMYGSLYGSFGMAEDKNEKTYIRIKSSPTRAWENYIGKVLGMIGTLVLQALILILFTKYAYGCNWGSNMTVIILFSILFSVCTTALGVMAYALMNDSIKASGIINVLVVFFTFISGGYAKINVDGSWFEWFSYVSPNKMFQTAVFNTVYGGAAAQAGLCVIALIVVTIVMFVIAGIFGRRELA